MHTVYSVSLHIPGSMCTDGWNLTKKEADDDNMLVKVMKQTDRSVTSKWTHKYSLDNTTLAPTQSTKGTLFTISQNIVELMKLWITIFKWIYVQNY